MLYNEIFVCITIFCITFNTGFSFKHHNIKDLKNCDNCKGNECRFCVYNPKSPKHTLKLKAKKGDLSSFIDENHKNVKNGHYHTVARNEGIGGSLGTTHNHHRRGIIALNHTRNSQYIGEVEIGTPSQKIYPIFDTGSTNLWTVGAECSSEFCNNIHVFDSQQSNTFNNIDNPSKLYIKFGTGEIKGYAGYDRVKIGNLVANDQAIGVIVKEFADPYATNPFRAMQFEGIVGLGFPELASIPGTPLFDNLIKQNMISSEFSFYLSDDTDRNSYLFFGGTNEKLYNGPMHMFPVVREHYWEVKLDAFYIGDIKFCCDEPSYIIFDSGTSFNTLPSREFNKFFDKIPEVDCDNIDNWPVLTYVIHGIKLELKPQQYALENGLKCRPAFMQLDVPSEFGHAYILGTYTFMRHYVTLYKRSMRDGQPSLVGVAQANHDHDL